MRLSLVVTLNFLIIFTLNAQDYSSFSLSPLLIKKADAIKRDEVMEITIKSPKTAVYKHTYVYTVFNAKGADYAAYVGYYNKFFSIEDIEGKLFNAMGKEIKKVRKKDIADQSSESGMSVSDTRYKTHNFYHSEYPYTVEYTCTVEINGMFYLPSWSPQVSPSIAVQKSKLIVNTPANYKLRYKNYNYPGEEKKTASANGNVYEWSVENIPVVTTELYMPAWSRVRTKVALAPSEFEISGVKGNMESWKDFGGFIYKLTEGRDALPEPMVQKVKELTADLNSPYQKIEALYDYLQNNTRYISVQLGIGGWQTIPAAQVARNGYGDCKALSNYMYAMLREAGINSKYVIISAGDEGLYTDVDFVHNQFNHAILCVPLAKDTVWLECTSNTLPAGYLGDFTGNRYALIVDENGGSMVRTPTYKKTQNLQVRKVNGEIDANGDLLVSAHTKYTGLQQDDLQGFIATASKENVLKYLRNGFELPTYDIINFDYKQIRQPIPELEETIDLDVNGYAQVSGKRLFIVPNILSKSGVKVNVDSIRKFKIELDYDYLDVDTVQIKIPEGYEVESLPKPSTITSRFGEYQNGFSFEENTLVFTRMRSQNSGTFEPAVFQEIADYYQAIYKADRARVVLRKKE